MRSLIILVVNIISIKWTTKDTNNSVGEVVMREDRGWEEEEEGE